MGKGATLAAGNIKVATRIGADLPLEGALALEREAVARLFMSEDAAEGLAAFAEKRSPAWKGPEPDAGRRNDTRGRGSSAHKGRPSTEEKRGYGSETIRNVGVVGCGDWAPVSLN